MQRVSACHHHHAETRHPGTADAAHRHARAGLRERNGPKPTRRARATRPATSQHRVGRRRRGSDERRRTLLFARELLGTFQQRELRCRYFLLVRSLGVALEDPNRARQSPSPSRALPHACQTHRAKKIRPLSGRPPTAPFVGGAPPPPMWATPHRLRTAVWTVFSARKPSTRAGAERRTAAFLASTLLVT